MPEDQEGVLLRSGLIAFLYLLDFVALYLWRVLNFSGMFASRFFETCVLWLFLTV